MTWRTISSRCAGTVTGKPIRRRRGPLVLESGSLFINPVTVVTSSLWKKQHSPADLPLFKRLRIDFQGWRVSPESFRSRTAHQEVGGYITDGMTDFGPQVFLEAIFIKSYRQASRSKRRHARSIQRAAETQRH